MTWIDLVWTVLGALALGLIVYAWAVEPYRIRISTLDIGIPHLSDSLDGFTICHLSDLHIGRFGRLERKLARMLSTVDADLCLITGDLLSAPGGVEPLAQVLAGLRPKHGIFAVLGNSEHDPWMPGASVADDLAKHGIRVLINECTYLSLDGTGLSIAGVDDPFLGLDDPGRALAGCRSGSVRILLAHSPDVLANLGAHAPDVILAGHTHGGQICIPFLGALWTHCRYDLKISAGYYGPHRLSRIAGGHLAHTQMYISSGLGGSGVRARFLCRPEVAILRLKTSRA